MAACGGGFVEGGEDAAAGVEALGDLEAEVAGDERGEAAGHAVGVGPRAAAELEDVAEALGGDQAGAGEAALEQGVGGDGGAVDEEVDAVEGRGGGVEGGEDAGGLVRGGRGLDEADGGAVEEDQVGEGAADVDAGHGGAHRRAPGGAPASGGLRPPLGRRLAVGRLCGLPPAEAACGRRARDSPRLLAGPLVLPDRVSASMRPEGGPAGMAQTPT